ncbi:PepSY-associated TM helix domain-containing protein [Sphingomonas jatrophae]|uniref:PepSY-associated TM region n=1 Tax=Sphingomonas jatrophae TaxID=1166337 RepID=A0A1I6M9Y4_9SPHN|nr:PepSY-associated TM helix domain-containing protein [Sphingomonas jatrophae]SFS12540.1 PepSY-associated TM region [Sphingomonas jatrophae]
MSAARTLRKVHYWASLFLLVSVFTIAISGCLLALKKDFATLQPPTRDGSAQGLSDRPIDSILASVTRVPGHERTRWQDIDRIDIRPKDGIAKVILNSRTEVQVDIFTGEAVETGYRTSDLLETIHDFSVLGGWAKYVLSFGSGLALLVMGGTGVYLFVLPFLVRRAKRAKGGRL